MTAAHKESPNYWASLRLPSPGNAAAVRALFARHPNAAILESVGPDSVSGRWSYYAIDPTWTATADGASDLTSHWAALREPLHGPAAESGRETAPPFRGGWIGHLCYEAGRWTEPTAGWRHAPTSFGLSQWRFYDTILAHDRLNDHWFAIAVDGRQVRPDRAAPSERARHLAAFVLENVQTTSPIVTSPHCAAIGDWNLSDDEYLQRVSRILDYIHAGDVYQVNLTRRFRSRLSCEPASLYLALCDRNPAAYAALLRFDSGGTSRTIQSSSPELLLSLDNDLVTTRPIKGTRPRTGDAKRDAAMRAELDSSEKERAELNMIIDLERNDLGRVCDFGTIRVEHPGEIESHPTVFHRTATIRGRLRRDCDALDLLRATFPGGSITGAPKVRAMQIINELETEARGPYCGAIGYIGVNGAMRLNLPIRTLTTMDDTIELAVGSGIVADSDPRAELEELHAKAAGMMRAIATCQSQTTPRDRSAGEASLPTTPIRP
ncbi:MAG TPA: anthranilate synthase component I family protein [Phycisphaerae bacterium]|nr:anthranilate synthase component I family protein [Phycisphaerae bacterium]HRW54482.1 anthranilate synthase component I family protein [Phycisphaerae bacterium]